MTEAPDEGRIHPARVTSFVCCYPRRYPERRHASPCLSGPVRIYLIFLGILAPRAGFEPATIRLTVECSTAELPRNKAKRRSLAVRITKPSGLAKDELC